MPEISEFIIDDASAGERLDRFLRIRLPELSRAALSELIGRGAVHVNGRRASKGQMLCAGDRIAIQGSPAFTGEPPSLRVLYEDRWLVAVDKPAGVPSHPLRMGETGTVANALVARYPEMRGVGYRELEPGLLHRLDNETSGVLIAARDPGTFARLREAHARGEWDKRYLALSAGVVAAQRASAFLRADRRQVRVEFEGSRGKPIVTEIVSSERRGPFSLVAVFVAFAGRHQVRAHLAALGHPIVGDGLYGGPSFPGLSRHFLHASEVRFRHPIDGQLLTLTAALPDDLRAVLDALPPSAA